MSETKLAKRRSMRAYRAEMGLPGPGGPVDDEASAEETAEDEIAVAADAELEGPVVARAEELEPRS